MIAWTDLVWIGLGGAAGALGRFAVTRALPVAFGIHLGTLAVNVLGCLAFGLFVGWWGERAALPEALRLGVFVGFLGSFTTFSTYGADTVQLAQSGAGPARSSTSPSTTASVSSRCGSDSASPPFSPGAESLPDPLPPLRLGRILLALKFRMRYAGRPILIRSAREEKALWKPRKD